MVEYRGETQLEKAVDGELALAGHARVAVVGDADLIESQTGDHAAQVRKERAKPKQGFDDLSIDQAEVAHVARNGVLAEFVYHPVAQPPKIIEQHPFRTLFANPVDDVVTLLPKLEKGLQHLGRILQIGIGLHDRIAAGVQIIRQNRALEAVVLRKANRPDARISRREL